MCCKRIISVIETSSSHLPVLSKSRNAVNRLLIGGNPVKDYQVYLHFIVTVCAATVNVAAATQHGYKSRKAPSSRNRSTVYTPEYSRIVRVRTMFSPMRRFPSSPSRRASARTAGTLARPASSPRLAARGVCRVVAPCGGPSARAAQRARPRNPAGGIN